MNFPRIKRVLSLSVASAIICGLLAAFPSSYAAELKLGDVDGNGSVTAADARLALREALRKIDLEYLAYHRADVDLVEGVTAADARLILRYSLGKLTKFPKQGDEPDPRDQEYTNNTILPWLDNVVNPAAGKTFLALSEIPTGEVPVNSSTKEIGRFVFTTEDNPGLPFNVACYVTDTAITALVPAGVDLSALLPSFTFYGKSVQMNGAPVTSGVTAFDLTAPVTLTLTANDDSTRTVTVTVETLNTGLPSIALTNEEFAGIDNRENYVRTSFYLGGGDSETVSYAVENPILAPGAVKGRGNSSWAMDKKSYTLKLDEKANLLGLSNSRDWALISNYEDKSLLRNHIASWLAEEAGMPVVMNGAWVDLWINGIFWGTYYLIEKIEIEGERVNITSYKDAYAAAGDQIPAPQNVGYLLEFDAHVLETGTTKVVYPLHQTPDFSMIYSLDPEEVVSGGKYCDVCRDFFYDTLEKDGERVVRNNRCPYDNVTLRSLKWEKRGDAYYNPVTDEVFFSCYGKWITIKKPGTENLTQAMIDYIINKIRTIAAMFRNKDSVDYRNYSAINAAIDVQSFVQWYIVEALTNNTDCTFHSSCYMYIDVGGKLKMGPLWDFDRSLGNSNYWNAGIPGNVTQLYEDSNSWFRSLFNTSQARTMLKSTWNAMKANVLNPTAKIDEWLDIMYESQKLNFMRWNILSLEVGANPCFELAPYKTYFPNMRYDSHINYLNAYMKLRFAAFDSYITGL